MAKKKATKKKATKKATKKKATKKKQFVSLKLLKNPWLAKGFFLPFSRNGTEVRPNQSQQMRNLGHLKDRQLQ